MHTINGDVIQDCLPENYLRENLSHEIFWTQKFLQFMVLNSFMNVPVKMSLLLAQTPDRRSIAAQPWQRAVHMIQWPSRRSPWEMPRPLASGTCAQRKTEHTAATQVQLKEWMKR